MKKSLLHILMFFMVFAGAAKPGEAQISFSIKILPPEPFFERPPPPSNNHVWMEGEWEWKGNHYDHKPGHWAVPPRDQIWVKGEWIQNPDGSSYWQPGYW